MDLAAPDNEQIDFGDDDQHSVLWRPPSQSEGFAAAAEDAVSVMSMSTLKVSMIEQIVRFDETVCIIEDGTQLDAPSSISLARTTNASSGSDSTSFSTYGLQRALNATIPASTEVSSKKQVKNRKYRDYTSDRYNTLLAELDAAREAFDAITEERDLNESRNLRKSMRLNRMVLQANMRFNAAEREFDFYVDEVEELRKGLKMTREEAEEWNGFSLLLKQRFDENDEVGLLDALQARMRKAGRA